MARCYASVVLALVVLVGCEEEPPGRGGLRATVGADDGTAGIPCLVKINSDAEPFYAPEVISTTTGQEIDFDFSGPPIEGVHVTVECTGYRQAVVRDITLRPGTTTALGTIKVRRP
jgi:hypothetical protein